MVQAIINLSEEEDKFLNIYKAQRGIKSKNQAIKEMIQEFEKHLDDIEFARRTEEAYQAYERGEFTRMNYDDFIKEIKNW